MVYSDLCRHDGDAAAGSNVLYIRKSLLEDYMRSSHLSAPCCIPNRVMIVSWGGSLATALNSIAYKTSVRCRLVCMWYNVPLWLTCISFFLNHMVARLDAFP